MNNVNVSGPIQPTSTYKTKVLKGNHSFASQVTEPNMKYVIKHDFVLDGNVTVPENCILEFDGGSISGKHTITGNNTKLCGTDDLWIDLALTNLGGTFANDDILANNMGLKIEDINASSILNKLLLSNIPIIEVARGKYYITNPIRVGFRKTLRGVKIGQKDSANNGVIFFSYADFQTLFPNRGVIETINYASVSSLDYMHWTTIENIVVRPYNDDYTNYGFDFGIVFKYAGEHSGIINCSVFNALIANIFVIGDQAVMTLDRCSVWSARGKTGIKNSGFGVLIDDGTDIDADFPYKTTLVGGGVRLLELSGDANTNSHICVGRSAFSVLIEGLKSEAHSCVIRVIGDGKEGLKSICNVIGCNAVYPNPPLGYESFCSIGYPEDAVEETKVNTCAPWIILSGGRYAGFANLIRDYIYDKVVSITQQGGLVNYDVYGISGTYGMQESVAPYIIKERNTKGPNNLGSVLFREELKVDNTTIHVERTASGSDKLQKAYISNGNEKVYEVVNLTNGTKELVSNRGTEFTKEEIGVFFNLALKGRNSVVKQIGTMIANNDETFRVPIFWNGLNWILGDGYAATKRVGYTADRPVGVHTENGQTVGQLTGADIGFCYYDMSLDPRRPIYASSINQTTGEVIWRDATGATV